MLTLDSVVTIAPDQISAPLSGEIAILNMQNGVYYGLNPVGAFIWTQLEEARSVRALCDAVINEYDVERERCETDVFALLTDMQTHGLITIR